MVRPDQMLSIALQFIDSHIASADELELLIAIVDTGDRWWDAQLVSRECGMSTGDARRSLERLAAANLLDIRVTDDVRYQFRPGTQELHDGAIAVSKAYRMKPAELVRHARRTSAGVRDFANAFRMKRNGRR